ncbi:MAG TPA: hypothetical protein VFY40_01215 [Blastocatellia bacterium]|nr:hypothetical protein [Blastocatellia bacterium]
MAPVNEGTGLEASLQSQASSSAQNNQFEGGEQNKIRQGERRPKVAAESDPNGGEQMDSSRVSQSSAYPAQIGEQEGEQPRHNSQWLKSILPAASNGWWDIRDKGNKMTIKFRWRSPDLQVMTLLRVTSEQFETLKQSEYENARNMIKEQISLRLHDFSLDPAKRDKALIVAEKLGINIGEYQIPGVED